ncbi:MAG TPA: hypothetical protein VHF25_03985 [Nitriliruptorales bacterium]|nr:hypothetical protein [Nitriliruptorales bacterium]
MTEAPGQGRPDGDPAQGVTRRDAMRRLAGLGVTLAWTAPVVQRLGTVSASAQVSPVPPPPPPPPPPLGAEFPSNVQVLLLHVLSATTLALKFDEGDGGWGRHPDNNDPSKQCLAGNTWHRATDEQVAFWNANAPVTKSVNAAGCGVYTFTVPTGYVLIQGYAKCGQNCPAATLNLDGSLSFSCC